MQSERIVSTGACFGHTALSKPWQARQVESTLFWQLCKLWGGLSSTQCDLRSFFKDIHHHHHHQSSSSSYHHHHIISPYWPNLLCTPLKKKGAENMSISEYFGLVKFSFKSISILSLSLNELSLNIQPRCSSCGGLLYIRIRKINASHFPNYVKQDPNLKYMSSVSIWTA